MRPNKTLQLTHSSDALTFYDRSPAPTRHLEFVCPFGAAELDVRP